MNNLKDKTSLINVSLMIVVLAIITISSGYGIVKNGLNPVSPNAPGSKPKAGEDPFVNITPIAECRINSGVPTLTPTPTIPLITVTPTPTPTVTVTPTQTLTPTPTLIVANCSTVFAEKYNPPSALGPASWTVSNLSNINVGDKLRFTVGFSGPVMDAAIRIKRTLGGVENVNILYAGSGVPSGSNWRTSGDNPTDAFTITDPGDYEISGYIYVNGAWK